MKRSLALLAVLAIFVTGVASGALGMHLYQAGRVYGHGPFAHLHHRGGPDGPPPFLEDLEDELGLSSEQRDQVDAIIRESREEAEALRDEVAPRVHRTMEDAHRRILAVLTPEQRAQLDENHPRLRRHLGEGLRRRHEDGRPGARRGPGPPPPPPPGAAPPPEDMPPADAPPPPPEAP